MDKEGKKKSTSSVLKRIQSNIKDDEMVQGTALQKRIANAFGGLQNPTLPSAYKLRDAALGAGFFVEPKRQHWLAQFETIRG